MLLRRVYLLFELVLFWRGDWEWVGVDMIR